MHHSIMTDSDDHYDLVVRNLEKQGFRLVSSDFGGSFWCRGIETFAVGVA